MTPTGASAPDWVARSQTGLVKNDDRVDWTEAYRLFPGDVAYIFHAWVHAVEVAAGLEAVRLPYPGM